MAKSNKDKLNDRQQRFVAEYLVDLNATQAAIRVGYSPKTAQAQSSRLLTNVMVSEAIRKRREELAEKTDLSQETVVRDLAELANKCLGRIKVKRTVTLRDQPDAEPIEVEETIFDPAGANSALDKLAKHFGAYEQDNKQRSDPLADLLGALTGRVLGAGGQDE